VAGPTGAGGLRDGARIKPARSVSAEALLELVPNVLPTEYHSTQRHLDAPADLAAAMPSFRLRLGSDPLAAVAAVEGLLGAKREAGR
jgi:hypothetical protein